MKLFNSDIQIQFLGLSYTLITFLMLSVPLYSNSNELSGKVISSETNEPLPGAIVRIEGTALGGVAGSNGSFSIKYLQSGKYKLIISMVGYSTKPLFVDIDKSKEYIEIKLEEFALSSGEVIVSASKRVQAVQEVPISVSLISENSINARNIHSLDDVLEYTPGVEVTKDNVSIRGSEGFSFGIGSRTALLLDGVPFLTADNSDMKFDAVPLFNVGKIEIVKGAGSALYGASAMGGVINIITNQPQAVPEYKFRAFGGLYTQYEYEEWQYTDKPRARSGFNASFSRMYDDLGVLLSGGFVRDDSHRDWDDETLINLFSKLNYDFSSDTKLMLSGLFSSVNSTDFVYWSSQDSASRPPTGTDTDNRTVSDKYNISAKLNHIFNSHLFMDVITGYYVTEYRNTLNDDDPQKRQASARSANIEIQLSSLLYNDFMISYGIAGRYNSVESVTFGDRFQSIFSAYIQAENKSLENFIITLGSRFDLENDNARNSVNEISPKFGMSYQVLPNLSLRASAGKGFRPPSIAERYSSVSFGGLFEVVENDSLIAETNISFELGTHFETLLFGIPFSVDFAFFDNSFENLIEPKFILGEALRIRFDNVTKAKIRGVEFGLQALFFDKIGVMTSFTYMDPVDETLNQPLKYRRELIWQASLRADLGVFEWQGDYRFKKEFLAIDSQLAFIDNSNVPVHIFDTRIIYNAGEINKGKLELTLNVYNMFDYYYTEMVGNLGPTRHISLQADLVF